ncbi:Conserved_hypothetical protein [Hexamita inflata]|uniref:Phage tail collar domain-containing protein n=1 Tax=Hexamita inflata TaxID=28002 RepID=A0ABP1GJS5_9EUKA
MSFNAFSETSIINNTNQNEAIIYLNNTVISQYGMIANMNTSILQNVSILRADLTNVNKTLLSQINGNDDDIALVNNSLSQLRIATITNNTAINTTLIDLNANLTNQQFIITANLNSLYAVNNSFNIFSAAAIINNTNQQNLLQVLQTQKQQTLPIGTILMFDAAGWVDDSTMTGWYACTAANHNSNNNIPNLESQFIRGISPSARQSSVLSSGAGSVQINLQNLPPHTHNMNHSHNVIILGQDPGIHGSNVNNSVLIQNNQQKVDTYSFGNENSNSYTSPPNIIKTGDGGDEGAHSIPIDLNSNIKQYALIFIKRVI